MKVGLRTNIASLKTDRSLNNQTKATERSFSKIASGDRITKASDDAAGLAIALELASSSNLRDVATRNISDGVSLANIAEGSLSAASDITTRLSELSTQSANGTLNDDQRQALNQEYQALRGELDRISNTTEFNGRSVFGEEVSIQAGNDGSDASKLDISLSSLGSDDLGIPTDISTIESATAAIESTSKAVSSIASQIGELGSFTSRLETAFSSQESQGIAEREAESRIRDVDVASESSKVVGNSIRQQSSVSIKAQANIQADVALKLLS